MLYSVYEGMYIFIKHMILTKDLFSHDFKSHFFMQNVFRLTSKYCFCLFYCNLSSSYPPSTILFPSFTITWSDLLSFSIISLYTSVVLVVGRLIRVNLFMKFHEIMFKEFPGVDYICELIDKIYLAREVKELEIEEVLYAKLLFLYRSPETMISITRLKMKEKQE